MTEVKIPTRVTNLEKARKLYGSRVDYYVSFLNKTDALADAVVLAFEQLPRSARQRMLDTALDHGIEAVPDAPHELKALFAQVDEVPSWVDWKRLQLGARTYQRTGLAGSLILSAYALMNGYHSNAATKPLLFTGQLDRMARRRLAETGKFIADTIQVNGLRRFARGFKTTIKVRFIHAQVRRFILQSGRWNADAWGQPINQADMLATNLSFSIVLLDGTRKMGLRFTTDEADALMELWRYSGYLSGIDPGLLCSSERDGMQWALMIDMLQPGPDKGSRLLAGALRNTIYDRADTPIGRVIAPLLARYHDGLTRATAGDEVADDLGLGNPMWKHAISFTRATVTPLELLRERLPLATRASSLIGNWVWNTVVNRELRNKPAMFHPPPKLRYENRFAASAA